MSKPAQTSFSDEQSDEFIFAQEDEETLVEKITSDQPKQNWKILIVDDEVEVHHVTKLALSDFMLEGKTLTFISAYSAQEAKQLIQAHPDIAIIFLDVVMETEDAGLQVVQYIREELDNSLVRIILRTGQPGRVPENVVAVNYGIDDYKTKTELTAQKLFITVVTALRAFSTLIRMLEVRQNLEREVSQHQQAETMLRVNQISAHQKIHQLEQSLRTLQQTKSQSVQREKIETLHQLVTEIAEEMIDFSGQAIALQSMPTITRIARIVLRITDEHSAKLGISQSKLAVLIYLGSASERCASPSALAKHCGVSRAAMTGLLDRLEEEEYVERDDHPSDRRALMVKLTQKGQQFLDWIAPQDRYPLSELTSSLDDFDRKQLIDFATKVIKLFEVPAEQ